MKQRHTTVFFLLLLMVGLGLIGGGVATAQGDTDDDLGDAPIDDAEEVLVEPDADAEPDAAADPDAVAEPDIDADADADADAEPATDSEAGIDLDASDNDDFLMDDDGDVIVEGDTDPQTLRDNEIARRKAKFLEAEQGYKAGNKAMDKGDFERAIQDYTRAQKNYEEAAPGKPKVVLTIKKIEERISNAYSMWADTDAKVAATMIDLQKFDEAIQHLQDAKNRDPGRRDEFDFKIKKILKHKDFAEFRQKIQAARVISDKKKREEEVDLLLAQGKVYFDANRFQDARDYFEQVLLKDFYNPVASRYMQQIYKKLETAAVERINIMKAERIAEVAWKWADPIQSLSRTPTPAPTGDRIEKLGTREGADIWYKLDTIRIPHISFEEATIHTVIKHIKSRSVELDPDQQGVNIILQLKPPGTTTTLSVNTGRGIDNNDDDIDFESDDDGGFDEDDDIGFDDDEDNFLGDGGGGGFEPEVRTQEFITITLDLNNVPLIEAIRYICSSAGLKYKVEPHAVIIAHPDVPLETMETRFYPIEAGVLQQAIDSTVSAGGFDTGVERTQNAQDPQSYFTSLGVEFPTGARVAYDARTSKLIVHNTPDNLRRLENILREINIQPNQVTIESKFVEVSQQDLDELGFEWLFLGVPTGDDFGSTTDKFINFSGDAKFKIFKQSGSSPESFAGSLRFASPGFTAANDRLVKIDSILGDLQFRTIIRAIEQRASADVLSAPRVTTLSGNQAVIKMVDERSIPTDWSEPELQAATDGAGASFTPSIPSFETREIGVVLVVSPVVAADGYSITLALTPEVLEITGFDDFSYKVKIAGEEVDAILRQPIVSKRTVDTSVIIWDGETVVLGGMIRESIERLGDNVPYISKLPMIGRLFKARAVKRDKRNLLIFVSARLVNPAGLPIRPMDIRGLPDFRH